MENRKNNDGYYDFIFRRIRTVGIIVAIIVGIVVYYKYNYSNENSNQESPIINNQQKNSNVLTNETTSVITHNSQIIDTDSIVKNLIDSVNSNIKNYSIYSLDDMDAFLDKIQEYNSDLSNYSNNKGYNTLKKSVISFQTKYFPIARKVFYEQSKATLWEQNIDVSMSGRTITFTGYMFADNGTIKTTYNKLEKTLLKLRFLKVGFSSGFGTTYFTLSDKNFDNRI